MSIFGHLNIKSKLILMMLSTSLCSILVIGYIGYDSGKTALTRSNAEHLTSVRVLKAAQIRAYFADIRTHTATLGEDEMIVSAMKELKGGYGELSERSIPAAWDEAIHAYYKDDFLPQLLRNIEGTPAQEMYEPEGSAARYLQFHYIASNPNTDRHKQILDRVDDDSRYAAAHARYNPLLRNLVGGFGYEDLLLIDIDTGDLVYTVAKEPDFATNLDKGPYRESNLAKLFKALREGPDKGVVKIADFKPYRPLYAAPQAFVATPIFDGKKAIGVLAVQLPSKEINDVMTGHKSWKQQGLGDTGETYLAGPDGFMRSDSRFLIEDRDGYRKALRAGGVPDRQLDLIDRMNTSILLQEVRTESVEEALSGKEDTRVYNDYRGVSVLASYAPARVEGLDWVIVSKIDLSEVNAPIEVFERRVVISSSALVIAVTLLALFLSVVFTRPITLLIEGARRVGKGDHHVVISLKNRDEIGELADTFNEMVEGIRRQTDEIAKKNSENEALLLNILPGPVALRHKGGEERIADTIQQATVLFANLAGFTRLAEQKSAEEAAAILNELVDSFDEAAERNGVEKVKTIGDKYLAVCGLSVSRLDHARRAALLAKEMQAILRQFNQRRGTDLGLQIGLSSGPVTAGIIGAKKFIYDLWGETVNTAGRLHVEAARNTILVTQSVYARLSDVFEFAERGDVAPAGKGALLAWELKESPLSAGAVATEGG